MWIALNKKWHLNLNPDTKGIWDEHIEHYYAYVPVYTRDEGWIWRKPYHYQEIKYFMPGELFPKWIKIRPNIRLDNGKFKTLSPYVAKKENLCNYRISLMVSKTIL